MQLIEEQHTYEQLLARIQSFDAELKSRDVRIRILEEQLQLARVQKFGPSAERFSPDQMTLALNEAESLTAGTPPTAELPSVTIPEHSRKARGHRKALPAHLPQVEVIHDLPESEKVCPHDGNVLKHIGADVTKQLDYIPAKIQVLVHTRLKYACPCCDQTIKVAPVAPQLLPKSNASPGLLAHIVTAKYVDGLPLYRQESQFERLGVALPRVTTARWMIAIGNEKIVPLINLLNDLCWAHSLIHLDETPVQVLKSDKSTHSDHYMCVRCAGPPGKRIVLFEYDKSRSNAVPARLLDDYGTEKHPGAILTDGYEAYATVVKDRTHLIHAGCWAHVRRKFDEAKKAGTNAAIERVRADEVLTLIRELYAIERTLKETDADDVERLTVRQRSSAPIIEQIKHWIDTQRLTVLPKSLLGKALTYTLNQWPKLIVFLQHAHIPLDNNRAENAIRPFVIGRKNWLFCDTIAGARASANLYSLIETAKTNGLEPHAYFARLFTELPKAQTVADIEKLLPFKKL